jgi:hypothetical protein
MSAFERVLVGTDLVEATSRVILTRACQLTESDAIEV